MAPGKGWVFLGTSGGFFSPEEMKSAGAKAGGAALGLVVARAERRFDAENQRFFSLKECQAEWPKDWGKR